MVFSAFLLVTFLLSGLSAAAQDTLKGKPVQLKEVVIRPDGPIRVMKDTVEYRAGAYKIRPHDKLEDLLKQLPGMALGADGKVTVLGQQMTKLRVNGKDFFTNNLEDFLKRLPAEIISKLQVIDDYGDQANFTGIKTGKPQKMLNLVIKEGRSKGEFGDVELQGATNEQYGGMLRGNLWRDIHQLGLDANHNYMRTEDGKGQRLGTGFNYRTEYKGFQLSGNYRYGDNKQANSSESRIENITGQGSLFNDLRSSGFTGNSSHNLQLGMQHRNQKAFMNVQLSGSLSDGKSLSGMLSKQSGLNRLDQDSRTQGSTDGKNGSIGVNYSRNMNKSGHLLSFKLSLNGQQNEQGSNIRDLLRYYDQNTGLPLRDSGLQRQLDMRSNGYNLVTGISYTRPLGDPQAKVRRNVDLGYDFSARGSESGQQTAVLDPLEHLLQIDSLSSSFRSDLMLHQLGITFRQNSAKLSLDAGLSVEPGLMKGRPEDGSGAINYHMFNVLPKASLRYTISRKYNAGLYYTSGVTLPEVNQLMPVADQRNLRNVIVGNPELKPSVSQIVNMEVNRVNPAKGQTFGLSLMASFANDQVVRNVLLVTDTLGGLRQETRFLNADGSYSLGAGYNMALPFAKIFQLRFDSRAGLGRNVLYIDNQAGASKSLTFSQDIGLMVNTKIMALNTGVNYSLGDNSYTLGSLAGSRISSMDFRTDARFTFSSLFKAGLDGSYRINRGYTIPVNNPVVVNMYAEWFVGKSKAFSLAVYGYDLLDQQNAVSQLVTAGSITQRTRNRIGRYVMMSLKVNVSRFGKNGK